MIDLLNRILKQDFRMHYSLRELAMANGVLTILLAAVLALVYFGYAYIT